MTLIEYLTDECRKLKDQTEDFNDALTYIDDIVSNAQDEFPSMVDEDIEVEAIRIMKSFYDPPGQTPTDFRSIDNGPD